MSRATHPVSPEELMAYLDGELPVDRARECAVHLEQCAECQAIAADFRSVGQQMMAWQVEAAPASLSSAITAAAQQHPVAPAGKRVAFWRALTKPLPRRWVWALSGAGVALLLVVLSQMPIIRHGPASKTVVTAPFSAGDSLAQKQSVDGQPQADEAVRQFLEQNQEQNDASLLRTPERNTTADTNGLLRGLGDHAENSFTSGAPMIARTASLTIVVKDFDPSRAALDAILGRHGGYAAQLQSEAPEDQGRTLTATLRVPANQLDAVLAEIKKLGRVERESQGGEEVTGQYVDLNARLSNARSTEQRLIEVLNQRTGKMADILAVENEIARVRGEIEQMEAERQNLEHRVTYSELQVELKEQYKAALDVAPPSEGSQLWNSLVEGLSAARNSLFGFVQIVAACLPTALLWGLILFWPARWLWRRRRAAGAGKASA